MKTKSKKKVKIVKGWAYYNKWAQDWSFTEKDRPKFAPSIVFRKATLHIALYSKDDL